MNIEYFTAVSGTGDEIEMVNLINEDGSFTQMLKETYDAQLAAQVKHLTGILPTE